MPQAPTTEQTAPENPQAPVRRGMSTRTAVAVIAGCVVLAGLVFGLTSRGTPQSGTGAAGAAAVAGLGTGKPTLYEFSTDT